jgi:hypothetical protein
MVPPGASYPQVPAVGAWLAVDKFEAHRQVTAAQAEQAGMS